MTRRRHRVALVLVAAAVLADARPADACSCGVPLAVRPDDGATGVPVNARVVVRDNANVRIESAVGAVVVASEQRISYDGFRSLYAYTPTAALEPDTEYVVYADDIEAARFTTGSATDTTAPEPITVDAIAGTVTPTTCDESCDEHRGAVSHITLSTELAADAVLVRVAFSPDREVVVTEDRVFEFVSRHAAECAIVPPRLEAGTTTCLTLSAIDAAGNESPPTEACFEPTACASVDVCTTGFQCDPASATNSGCTATNTRGSTATAVFIALLLAALRRHALKKTPSPF